ncbi:MAG: hypothetical protein KatS3mg105_4954 [Gemmatales bacterium]|nr:MAG: hypothetical protein KatS3mg105_4954 [Gemmatales bacterium]
MPTNLPTPKDIESWIPRHLDEIVGCEDVREHFRDCLRLEGRGQNTPRHGCVRLRKNGDHQGIRKQSHVRFSQSRLTDSVRRVRSVQEF